MDLFRSITEFRVTYDDEHIDLINFFCSSDGADRKSGGVSEEDKQDKLFNTYYKLLMMAILIGIRHDTYDQKLEKRKSSNETTHFYNYKPRNVTKMIFTACLTHKTMDKSLFDVENFDDAELDKLKIDIRDLVEAFANGGLAILKDKMFNESNPSKVEVTNIQDVFTVYDELMKVEAT